MSEKIDKIGKATMVAALKEYFGTKPEPPPEPNYIFQVGDVVKNGFNELRVIRRVGGEFKSFSLLNGRLCTTGQEGFEQLYYKKVGTLIEIVKLFEGR